MKTSSRKPRNPTIPARITVSFPDGGRHPFPRGIRIKEIIRRSDILMRYPIMAARKNRQLVELNYRLSESCRLEFLDYSHPDAMRMYQRGLCFVLLKAVARLFPRLIFQVKHSISKGLYCEFQNGIPVIAAADINRIRQEMKKIMLARIPFRRKKVPIREAIRIFRRLGQDDKVRLFRHQTKNHKNLYYCGSLVDYFYGFLPPDTGYLNLFDLEPYSPGFILRYPEESDPTVLPPYLKQAKLSDIFREYGHWGKILGVEDVGSLNDAIAERKISEIVKLSEALHEKKLVYIADQITDRFTRIRLVLVAGPSSSGKTTFIKRLALQLKVNGLETMGVSLDNYFVERVKTPRDAQGNLDYESMGALDVHLFNAHLNALFRGKEVDMPHYDFATGRRKRGEKIRLAPNQLLIVEGIHGINDALTYSIGQDIKFKIYVSPITHLNIDNHNRIPNTDVRKIRRLVRDNLFRSYTAQETLARWPSVRRGEELHIYPFQDSADMLFNSSLVYELSVLKGFAEPQLLKIRDQEPQYNEAQRLLKFLSYFCLVKPAEIPPTSILREFIGGSTFRY